MTTAGDAVQKIFMNKRVNVNSRECLSRDNNGHASVAYNNSEGKHLERSSSRMVSSDADRPITAHRIEGTKKRAFAFLKEHLNVRPLIKWMMMTTA